jgi:sporulation protein YlmC with PRC-barrel domain
MQRSYHWIVTACVAGLLTATTAWAQQIEQPTQTQVQQHQTKGDLHSAGLFKASKLLGMDVKGNGGEELGEIEDLVFDSKSGKIRYAAVSMGGFLGIGDKLVAVPWDSFQFRTEGQGDDAEYFASLNINKERMKMAKGFDEDHWPTSADQVWQTGAEGTQEDVDVDVDVQRERTQETGRPIQNQ